MHASGCGAGTRQEGSSGSGVVGVDAASRGLPLSPHALSASGTSSPASFDDVAPSPGDPAASPGGAVTSPGASFDPAGASPGTPTAASVTSLWLGLHAASTRIAAAARLVVHRVKSTL